jgi:hypothetical protein
MYDAAALEVVDKVVRYLRNEEVETITPARWAMMT